MSQGGNQRARTFFKQHGWDEVGSDKIEAKYTSRAAQLYRKQLEKDVIKALKGDTAVAAASSPEAAEKAAASLGPAVTKPSATATAAANKSRLVQHHHHRKPAGKGGLGVKKMVTKIDDSLFDQAPAQEEAEQPEPEPTLEDFAMPIAGSGGSRFNLDAMEERKRPAPSRGKDGHLTIGGSDDFFSNPIGSGLNRASSIDKPTSTTTGGGGGSGYSSGVSMFGRKQAANAGGGNNAGSTLAQEKFGNAKSISSAAFFDDGQRENDYEKQSKLAQFQGSQAISSDAYFGRESTGGGGGSGSNMDMTAADLVSKISITAKQDLGQLKDMAGQASAKLSQMAQSFMRDLQGGY